MSPCDQKSDSMSSLSELSRTPTPPTDDRTCRKGRSIDMTTGNGVKSSRKRKRTSITKRQHRHRRKSCSSNESNHKLESESSSWGHESDSSYESDRDFLATAKNPEKTTRPSRKGRQAGVSNHLFPPVSAPAFGLIQEKLWKEPFWLIIAVTFLNKTAGRVAAPIFWELKKRYPTPHDLACADERDLHDRIYHLGLQTQRSRRLIKIATAWAECPPAKGQRHRTMNYPVKGDGKSIKAGEIIEGDAEVCAGALEIGHIPGCGPYAWDSWRIFCRDVHREVATDFLGTGASSSTFEPEWKRVLPLDKELRACLRWMWLREGYIWDHETGKKRRVTEIERLASIKGELEPTDEDEARFTAEAKKEVYFAPAGIDSSESVSSTPTPRVKRKSRRRPITT